ncbi:MAG: D-alanyl-D-alanine carboxypeptidase family protein [Oscillospiraceae bacterium]
MKPILRYAVTSALLCAAIACTAFSGEYKASAPTFSASAETAVKSKILKGKNYWDEDTVIPSGITITVDKGASLYIMDDADITLNGKIKVRSGGSVYVRGNLISNSGSVISNNGKIKILSMGSISLSGKCSITSTAEIKGSGKLIVNNNFSDISCKGRVSCKITPPQPVTKDGVTTVGGVIIVNRLYHLPQDYGTGLDSAAYSALLKMRKASGYDMTIVSGFRSYEKQRKTFEYWESIDGFEKASTYSAQPGQSEHQTGLAMDITSLKTSYKDTDEGKWLAANCYKYGFIIRYPAGSTDITGYIYEPWHIRYLGESTARLVYFSGLTLEEFLGVKGI